MRKPDSIAPPGARPSLVSVQSDPSTNPGSSAMNSTAATSMHRRSSSSPEVEQIDNVRKNVTHRRSTSSLTSTVSNGGVGSSTPAPAANGIGIGSKRKRLTRPNNDEDDEDYVPPGTARLQSSSKALRDDEQDEDSDDGDDADAEYAELRSWASGLHSRALEMSNVSSRRRSSAQVGLSAGSGREAVEGGKGAGVTARRAQRDIEDSRRHSMVV